MGEKSNLTVQVEARFDLEKWIPATEGFIKRVVDVIEKYDLSEEDENVLLDSLHQYKEELKEAVSTRVIK